MNLLPSEGNKLSLYSAVNTKGAIQSFSLANKNKKAYRSTILNKKELSGIQTYQKKEANGLHFILILDRSKSMMGMEDSICGEFNRFIERNKNKKIKVSVVLANNVIEVIYDDRPIQQIQPFRYSCYGETRLYIPVRTTIERMERRYCSSNENLIYIIATGGRDTLPFAYRDFEARNLKRLIGSQKDNGRKFFLLGQNINLWDEAEAIGIDIPNVALFSGEGNGWQINFDALDKIMNQALENTPISDDWKKEIEKHCYQLGSKKII